jgi:hypothetical protein
MEAGMQQATPEHGQETQASAEGSCRLDIEQLHKIIQDYAQICLHSSREIEQLRNKLQQCTLDLHAKPSEGNVQNEGTIPVDIALRHNLRVCRERNAELATEVERLRSQPCPHVVGETTKYCSLTPFAWAADIPGKFGAAPTVLFGYTEKLVKGLAAAGGNSVQPFPLYRQPSLTKEEREAIAVCAQAAANCGGFGEGPAIHQGDRVAATLNGLLERLN